MHLAHYPRPCRADGSSDPQQRGIALVLVLIFLVLLSAILLGFFASVTTESASATTYASSATAKMLADSAVNLAEAQIRDATQSQSSGSPVAWVSQPGMIRTFEEKGQAKDIYKLYSDDDLVVGADGFSSTIAANWNTTPDLYTDLNAPDTNAANELIYPIVDPKAEGLVDGFKITAPPGYDSSKAPSTLNNSAPMPVKWLYLLQDGTMAAASPTKLEITGATAQNPIVGRIAFWTDDETAKVNINTASEGTYWDVPRVYSQEDYGRNLGGSVEPGMAVCQPAQREYQRYPGHPATTSLSPIFGKLLPVILPITAANASKLDPYYAIAPRIIGGGSGGGTKVPTGALVSDKDRLYASVDELMFTPKLAGNSRIPNTTTGSSAAPNLIKKDTMEKVKFFLTANSSAPETTLNNTPRVAIWPVHLQPAKQTAYDKLMVFCSTIGGKSYYFTREDARHNTKDYSVRNAELYGYLQTLTARDIPGFGGKFLTKYGAGDAGVTDRDQILTSIFDYIRCTNLSDTSNGAVPYTPLFDAKNVTTESYPVNAGEVVPIKIPALGAAGKFTQGFGRVYTISEADLIIYGTEKTGSSTNKMRAVLVFQFASPMQGLTGMRSSLKYTVTGLDKIQAKVGAATYTSLGFPATGTNYMENADAASFHGRSVGGTEGPTQAMTTSWSGQKRLTTAGGTTPGNYPFFTGQDFPFTPPAASSPQNFKIKSTEDIVVEIFSADTNISIQKLRFRFPEGEFKIPGVAGGTTTHDFNTRAWQGGGVFALVNAADTIIGLETAGTKGIAADDGEDPTAGDTRILAALGDVPATALAGSAPPMFRPDKKYSTVGTQFAYGLHSSVGLPFLNATTGKLVNVTGFPIYGGNQIRFPAISSRVGNEVKRADGGPGDWDTGVGDQKDGAYINKPDEGDAAGVDAGGGTRLPYMLGNPRQFGPATNTYFSPNRQMPSALMFGSIPTGIQRFKPWQTLLFHARPEDLKHPGRESPPDHLLADLFWMPVIEPYAISQPFATSGKINMNFQIQPFTYIRRDTGLQAVMKSTKFMALALTDGPTYKPIDYSANPFSIPNRRKAIDMNETLKAFDTKFSNNEVFKSATEICEIDLVPTGQTKAGMATFWNNNKLTGDNLREKPYVDIYPRLTTKSNTYTVHVRAQSLKKASGTPPNQWVPGRDQVGGEYRGSAIVERYIDVNDPKLPDFATLAKSNPTSPDLDIDQYYKMRVISTKRFAP